MSHKRLVALIQAQREAMAAHPEARTTHDSIRSILQALDVGEVTEGQALRLLGFQATRVTDEPSHAAIYRQAAADIRQMQREEH